MTGNPDRPLTIDTHHHKLPDFFWQETENAHAPVVGFNAAMQALKASGAFLTERLGSTAR
jgi:hypothetical protein